MEKIENYTKNGKKIDSESIAKLTNLAENHNISELIDNCLAKNKKKTINILIQNNFNSEDCILISRIFLIKLKKILKLCLEFQENKNLDLTISKAKPPIFWKEKEITKQQILNWTPKKVKETLFKVNGIEFSMKKMQTPSSFILNWCLKKLIIRFNYKYYLIQLVKSLKKKKKKKLFLLFVYQHLNLFY